MIRNLLCSALLLAGAGVATTASAATDTAGFQVTATVVQSCRIEAGNTLAFGDYDPTSDTAATGSTTIRVRCTNGTTAPIALNQGVNVSTVDSTCMNRAMKPAAAANLLSYGLYQSAGTSAPWGCATGTNTFSYTATNASWNTLTVHGVIAAAQNVPVGAYADTVTATITF